MGSKPNASRKIHCKIQFTDSSIVKTVILSSKSYLNFEPF